MTDDAHEVRTAAAAADDDAHAGTRRCAWPDGCAHPLPELTGGRPARYCGRRVDGRLHNRANAQRRRAELDRGAGPAHEARGAAHAPGPAPAEPDFSGRSAGQQAQLLAERLDALGPTLESYAAQLRLLGDVDAAGRQVEAIRDQAAAEVAAAERARADAVAAAEQARAELREETEAREEADALAERATEAQEAAETAATDARQHADRAQAESDRARAESEQQVAEAHRAAEADAAEVRAERDRILAEHQAAHDAELQQLRDQTAHEADQARAEAARITEAARRDAHEADQARARAEQRAHDAEQQMTWLREQLTAERTQYQEALDRARVDAEARVQPLLDDAARLRAELADARAEHAEQLRTILNGSPAHQDHGEHEAQGDEPTAEELALPWTEALPAPLVEAISALAEHGEQPASSRAGVDRDLSRRLTRVWSGVMGRDHNGHHWPLSEFRREVLKRLRTARVSRTLETKSPLLATDLRLARDLTVRYLDGDDLDGDQDHGTAESADEDLARPWTEGLPAPLIAAVRTLAEYGAQPASRETGIRKEQTTLLRRIANAVSTPEMSTGRFRQHVLGQFGRTLVDEQLRRGSPQLAADITDGKELTRRYLAGEDITASERQAVEDEVGQA